MVNLFFTYVHIYRHDIVLLCLLILFFGILFHFILPICISKNILYSSALEKKSFFCAKIFWKLLYNDRFIVPAIIYVYMLDWLQLKVIFCGWFFCHCMMMHRCIDNRFNTSLHIHTSHTICIAFLCRIFIPTMLKCNYNFI